MELLYLLCSIISTLLTSFALSLLLPFRIFFRRYFPSSVACSSASEAVTLYEGTVWHERRCPILHSFKYRVRYALVDLDLTPQSLPNHLSADEARRVAETNGPVFLLTIPPSVGYEQNPLSLYYCYDQQDSGALKKCIAEVTNTPWGERVSFLFSPNSDLVAKALHVSPFMDMLGNWTINATVPCDTLSVGISVHHPDLGDYFSAVLRAKKVPSSVSDHKLFFWLMPHKVAVWIYWHAFQLWWKNVPFVQHPRYTNSAYREEALLRDQKLKCCLAERFGSTDSCLKNDANMPARLFVWRDAKWPWC